MCCTSASWRWTRRSSCPSATSRTGAYTGSFYVLATALLLRLIAVSDIQAACLPKKRRRQHEAQLPPPFSACVASAVRTRGMQSYHVLSILVCQACAGK